MLYSEILISLYDPFPWVVYIYQVFTHKLPTVIFIIYVMSSCSIYLRISRHTLVCRAAQETQWVRQTRVYFTGVKKTPFSCICSSALPEKKHTKLSVQIPLEWGTFSFKFTLQAVPEICAFKVRLIFFVFFFFLCDTFWNCYSSCVLWWITLKFGALLLDHIRVYLQFNFCSNRVKKHWVIVDFQNFHVQSFVTFTGLTDTLNWLKLTARLGIGEVPFGG